MKSYMLHLCIAVLLTACGGVEVVEPEPTKIEMDAPDNGGGSDPSPDAPAIEDNKQNHYIAPDDVSVEVSVKVNVGKGSERPESDRLIYRAESMPWNEAVNQPPEGYRLATRAEAVALFDASYFDDIATAGKFGVWTATDVVTTDGRSAWTLDTTSGFLVPIDKTLLQSAIYVNEY